CTSGVPSLSMNAGNPRETVPGQRSSRTRDTMIASTPTTSMTGVPRRSEPRVARMRDERAPNRSNDKSGGGHRHRECSER
ncbi:hypothetical protein HN011_006037, partial [Eciton burchellii]